MYVYCTFVSPSAYARSISTPKATPVKGGGGGGGEKRDLMRGSIVANVCSVACMFAFVA